ncbi:MAG TPA: 2-oxoglutarate dehydrogenase E1 component [Planctomycetota bacterium]|nr:2-oxoglutarate dehydrogenase E1 component [Planctomycetota bacterium]
MSEADLFRRWGYLQADLDPLGRLPALPHPELDAHPGSRWRALYCGPLAVEFMHIPHPDRVRFVREAMESEPAVPDRERVLDLLLRGELLEQALQARYPGTKRFSLEGLTAALPLLDEILASSAAGGAQQVLMAMSHRGRLNVMVNIVGRPAREIAAGFEDVDPRGVLGGGDVKYHLGANGEVVTRDGRKLWVALTSNPSHLEAVDPVLMGRARARQDRLGGRASIVPVLLHGDAAFAGQGIAAETLNMADLPGYSVGGTIHVVLNNLVGFTTTPPSLHGGRFATDVAKRLPIPIFHVNAARPDAAVRAARIAVAWRAAFGTDVVIDLIGHRRHGHSEVDDPTTTQPALYRRIAALPPPAEAYAAEHGLDAGPAAAAIKEELAREIAAARELKASPELRTLPEWWEKYRSARGEATADGIDTAVPAQELEELGGILAATPDGFRVHPKLKRLLDDRRAMARGEKDIDWATAEMLALASLAREGVPIRLSGQDTRRGTFNQRHAILVDVESGAEHMPLGRLGGRVEILDSPLSEAAPVGFEYGYSREYPESLVLWEAQFGDFVNGAQVILDQYLSSAEDKWDLLSGLVLLLPHGYEGQGPEHSSARLERFLQLSAEDNWRVAQPTTAAQYFHLLRRQARRPWRQPLVVLTPKSLLRHPAAMSPRDALAGGRFRPVLGDDLEGADRILVCTGKVFHDLRAERKKRQDAATALVRLEELYPFPETELHEALARHPQAREIVWVQEEPANMGALSYVLPRMEAVSGGRPIRSVKRSPSASPATGSAKAHAMEQAALLTLALARPGR